MTKVDTKIKVDTVDAVDSLEDVRAKAEEARAAIDALESSMRALGKTTTNPQKDMNEMFNGGFF